MEEILIGILPRSLGRSAQGTHQTGQRLDDDLFSLPDDRRRYEIIEGELYEMPAPDSASAHAFTIVNLLMALYPVVTGLGGQIATARWMSSFPGQIPCSPTLW